MAQKTLTVLGLDPGKTNFGYAVSRFRGTEYSPVVAGKLKNTIRDMSALVAHMDHYTSEIGQLLRYKPDLVVIERFMNRGRFSGDQGEYVGVMVGLAAFQARATCDSRVSIVQPGVWKQAFNRTLGWSTKQGKPTPLDKMYKYCLAESHELDAYLMTHFGYSVLANQRPFAALRTKTKKQFLYEFESVATGKKKRKRIES